MQELNKKHVMLSMSNGHVLEGFVDEMGDTHLTLIETNNQKVLVKINDISFARMGVVAQQQPPMYGATIEDEAWTPPPATPGNEEFSMPLPTAGDNPYVRQPELVKRSHR